MKQSHGSNRQHSTPRPTAPLPRTRPPSTTPLGAPETTNENRYPSVVQSGRILTSNIASSRSTTDRASATWSSPAPFASGSRQPPPNSGGSSHVASSSSARPLNATRKNGGNQAGSSSHRSTKASGRQGYRQTSSQRRTLSQPLGPSSALEEILSRTRYSVTPQFRRQLISGKLQALGYEMYDEVPSVARPIAPRPVEQQAKKSRRKIRRGYDDEDLSDEELDVGHLPLTNPSFSRQLTSNTDRPTLRKATTIRVQEDSNRDRPVRGAKKMSASRESYGVNTSVTAPTVDGSDEEIRTQDMNTDSSMVMGGSDEEQGTMDYVPTGSPAPPLPDDLELPHAFPPPSGTSWTKRPATPLIEAFEEVDMDGRYRAGVQTVSGRLPFLKRNMRAVFERRAQRRRNLKASAAGYPEVGIVPVKGGRLYDLGIVLDEESILKRSRRAKKIVLQLENLYLPTNYAPHACNITVELHLKQNEGVAMRLSLLHADITIPRPQQEQGARYAIDFQPPLRATSDLLNFWSIAPPFTASGATVVITLSNFQGSGGRPLPWVLPGSASSPAGVGEKAEISLEVVSDDEPALFVSAERKVVPLEWIEGRNLPQREALMTAALSLSWEFEPTGKCIPPPRSLQESHATLVVIEFRHKDSVWKTKQFGWRCPLCDRFGAFSDPFFLECHIQVHHEQVEPVIDEDAARMPRIILTARPLQRAATTPFPPSEGAGFRTRSPTSLEQDNISTRRYESVRNKARNRQHDGELEDAEMGSSSSPSAVLPSAHARLRPKMPLGHPPSLDFVPNVNTAPEQNLGTVVPGPTIIIDLTRDSPEPAPKDPLGPADTLKGGTYTSAYDSSVFDILSELSFDVLGNQANRITTQLEQIYAHRELPVEDRVIAALWARWIALNRGKFLASYVEGFKAFVLESHDVIRRAAGVRALRNFLLVMAQYRFLKPRELCEVLDAYGNQVAGGVRDQ